MAGTSQLHRRSILEVRFSINHDSTMDQIFFTRASGPEKSSALSRTKSRCRSISLESSEAVVLWCAVSWRPNRAYKVSCASIRRIYKPKGTKVMPAVTSNSRFSIHHASGYWKPRYIKNCYFTHSQTNDNAKPRKGKARAAKERAGRLIYLIISGKWRSGYLGNYEREIWRPQAPKVSKRPLQTGYTSSSFNLRLHGEYGEIIAKDEILFLKGFTKREDRRQGAKECDEQYRKSRFRCV